MHLACHSAAPHQKPVYKQLKKEADRRLKAEVARRGRTGKRAAADVLDRLFEVASGGSDEAWAAAVGQLSEAERAALASQGVELEQYRQGLAARALGGDAGGLGSEREGGGGKEEEEEGEEPLSGSEEEADYDEEERSEWSTASEGEEEEAAAAGPSAARQQPSFFWERAQHAQRAQRTQQGFSPLHFEVEAFAQRATPTQQEVGTVLYWCLQVLGGRACLPKCASCILLCMAGPALIVHFVTRMSRTINGLVLPFLLQWRRRPRLFRARCWRWMRQPASCGRTRASPSLAPRCSAACSLQLLWICCRHGHARVCVCVCPSCQLCCEVHCAWLTTLLCMWTLHRLHSLCCCRPPAWRSPAAIWTLWCWGWVPRSRAPPQAFPKCRFVGWARVSRCGWVGGWMGGWVKVY